jgi:thiol-disulfide isomerase/thioredoxin
MKTRLSRPALAVLAAASVVVIAAAVAPAADLPEPLAPSDLDLAGHAGKVVLVDFWASWCKPCQVSLPWLSRLAAEHADDGLVVIAVNLDRDPADAQRMRGQLDPQVIQIHDPEGELAAAYELGGMPSSYLYDRTGTLREQHVGFLPAEADEREDQVLALLAEEVNRP